MRNYSKILFLGIFLPLVFLGISFFSTHPNNSPSSKVAYAQNISPSPSPTPTIIVWSKDRKLTWDDFQGPVPSPAPALDAESSVGVHSSWKTSHKCQNAGGGKRKCTVTITEVSAQAEFDQSQSWVKPDKKSDDLLHHEQGHFDISEIFAKKKQEQMNKFVGQSETATADTDEKAIEEAEKKIEKKLMKICDAINKEEDAMQKAYDTQTKHGTDADQQKKWDEKIQKLLNK